MVAFFVFVNINDQAKQTQHSEVVHFADENPHGTFSVVQSTSRDRPKSAPYPRLKNSKKTSKCQVFSITVPENRKFFEKKISKKTTYSKKWKKMDRVARRGSLARAPGALKSHNAEKLKGGTF